MLRTPAKSAQVPIIDPDSPTAGSVGESTGSSRPNVRRSIGEWESGKPENRKSLTPTNTTFTVGSPKPRPIAVRRQSAGTSGSPPKRPVKSSDKVAEARACVTKAKTHLSNSRNLKTDIKVGVTEAIDRLFQLVKESVSAKGQTATVQSVNRVPEKDVVEMADGASSSCSRVSGLENMMKKHMDLIATNTAKMTSLNEALDRGMIVGGRDDEQAANIGRLLGEVRDLRQTTEETGKRVTSLREAVPSYADVLARPTNTTSPTKCRPKHSIIVSSDDQMDTSDVVLGKVREAVEARTTGLQVTRVQKVKNQRVVLSCSSKTELLKVTERITTKDKGLRVEEAKNKDPLVMIRNLLTFNSDSDIVSSLRSQNQSLLRDLRDEEFRATVKYRRRARNPHESHVVLQVSPKLWLRLTEAGRVHIDLQYAVVQDQSPLVQCTRCLGYGHGRRQCTESADLCSYCAGPHLRADCPAHAAADTATCRNCRSAKYAEVGHNAFDSECPVRRRWDAIARSSVAYC